MRKKVLVNAFFILVFFFSFFFAIIYGAIPAQERAALIAFYNATNGDNWTDNSGWKTPPLDTDGFAMQGTEGTWYGINVSGDHVTEIGLRSNQLSGNPPIELGNLSNLKNLYLGDNQLTGSIPIELGNLSNLICLDLQSNQFANSIPKELENLSNLQALHLGSNQLSGSIPPELGNLSKLNYLDLESNQLSGSIPPELGNLTNLYRLGLELNQLIGSIPQELGGLSNLRWFNLESNQLTGSIPSELGNLNNVESILLFSNQLSGSIPKELGNLSNLINLFLEYNQLSGSIPSELGNLSNLQRLGLDLNQLSGSIPSELGNLSQLQYLDIKSNQLSGSIPPELGNLSNLTRLGLDSNQLSGSIPKELGNLNNVIWFNLQSNQLTGSIPSELGNLNNVKSLLLYSNQLSGSIPKELGNLSNLINLFLDYNQLSGSIPKELGNLSSLIRLGLGTNQLSGSIPKELENLSNLQCLDLWTNQLTGSIPPELGNLSNLQHLRIYSNHFIGSIPKELGNLSNLRCLYLSSNQLSGNIPTELGNLSNLRCLYLDFNQLSGNIPTALGNLSDLQFFFLNNNKLSGAIPTSLTNLTKLSSPNVDIGYNCLYTNDSELRAWLDSVDPDWESHQSECPTTPTYTLYISSTPVTGVGITVSPTDKDGYGNGSTNFTRTYDSGTIVTLEAPPSVNGSYFAKWSVDGIDNTNRNIEVTIESDHTAVVYYETAIPPEIHVSRKQLNLGYVIGSTNLPVETFYISNTGGGTLNWSLSCEAQWVVLNPVSGTNGGVVEVTINPVGLTPGKYEEVIVVSDPAASNSPVEVRVKLQVKDKSKLSPPFGNFATPEDNSTVRSSIPVTGWALGDTGIESVKIYREEGANLVYIGDAVFVEGARPDIEAAYPDYPMNYKAGWGYMMLTNFLPDGGNGVFKIHAIATDKEGQTTTLGVKTITVDNANAVKPFGAIDTPSQGGTASGNNFVNWGWVLTPQPNIIPTNGSTINVYVDGVMLGHPTYNLYRADIATLFPGYANNNGAAGYFYLDTTTYENGVHTIFWTAEDNAGNTDGIGSRYFIIQNSGTSRQLALANGHWSFDIKMLSQIPFDYSAPVGIRKGYVKDVEPQTIYPDNNGIINIKIKELERIELHLDDNSAQVEVEEKGLKNSTFNIQNSKFYSGYQVIGSQLRPLPIGSTFDTKRGIFYWQPGPAFIGEYEFLFIGNRGNNNFVKRILVVRVIPKFSKSKVME